MTWPTFDEHDGGWSIAVADCWSCGQLMHFNPERVPSLRIDPTNNRPTDMGGDPALAVAQPICRTCVELANLNRAASGRDPIVILDGAYTPRPES